jgi:hypothetical protein
MLAAIALIGIIIGPRIAAAACSTTICTGTNPCTISGSNNVDCNCTLDFGTKDVIVTGTLTTTTESCPYTLKANSFDVRGTIQCRGPLAVLDIQATNGFTVQVVSNSAAKLDVKNGGTLQVTAGGAANILGKDVTADGGTNGNAGSITISGSSFRNTSSIHADGASGGDGGVITLSATSGNVSVEGTTTVTGAGAGWGGAIALNATGTIATTKTLQANGGGQGGTIDITTTATGTSGQMAIDGSLLASGTQTDADAGQITLSGGSLSTSTDWTVNAGSGGSFGAIAVSATGGNITTANTSSMTANSGGGGDAGEIDIEGDRNVDLGGAITADTNGDLSSGGSIIAVAGNNHTLTVRKTLDAKSTTSNALFDGTTDLSACNVVLIGALKTRDTSVDTGMGENDVTYNGTFNATNATMLADDSGGNFIFCRCVDTSPADGTCDSPPTCVSPPTLTGATLTPTQVITPIMMGACG